MLKDKSRSPLESALCITLHAGIQFCFSGHPVLGQIVSSLKISRAQAGALMSAFALPASSSHIRRLLTDRYGPKRVSNGTVHRRGRLAARRPGQQLRPVGGGRVIAVRCRDTGRGYLPNSVAGLRKRAGRAMGLYNTAMPIGQSSP